MIRAFKVRTLLTSLVLVTMTSVGLFAQAGGAAVPFLLISPDARGSGMGEVGTAVADDINAIYWNPAGLGWLRCCGQSRALRRAKIDRAVC